MTELKCKGCGAALVRRGRAYVCDYCGSKYILDANDKVIHEEHTEQDCIVLMTKADEYRNSGNAAMEILTLQEITEREDAPALAFVHLGRCYRERGEMNKAIECYKIAQKIDADCPTAYSNEAIVHLLKGNYEEAVKGFEKALPLIGENDSDYPTIIANYALALGNLKGRCGARSTAIHYLKQARRLGYPQESVDTIKQRLNIKRGEWFFG